MKTLTKNICIFFGVFVLWQVASLFTLDLFIPAPISVASSLVEMATNGTLWKAMGYSLARISVAAIVAMIASLIIGIAMQMSHFAKTTVYPIVKLMRYLPATAFYPLLMMWFGINETMKIAFLTFVSFVYMMPSTVLALEDAPSDLMEGGRALGLSKWQTLRHVIFPYCWPSILKSFCLTFGIGWTYLCMAEETNAIYGLGFMINNASSRGKTEIVFAAIIVIVVISILFDAITNKLIDKTFKWRD